MNTINLVAFQRNDIMNILSDVGLETKKIDDKMFIIEKKSDQIKKCTTCEIDLTTRNLGNIAKGSNKLFCDNPLCFLAFLESKK